MSSFLFAEILALLLVCGLGYYMILEVDLALWWQEQLDSFLDFCYKQLPSRQQLIYLVGIGTPAIVVGLIDAALDHQFIHFCLSVALLLVGLRLSACMRYQPAIIKAVYANDHKLATNLANEWEGRKDGLEDGRERFVSRMLSLCATRVHQDLIAVLTWFVVLGPAGVALVTANQAFFRQQWAPQVGYNPVTWLGEMTAKLLFAICGSMAHGLQSLNSKVAYAALMAGQINPDKIDLELVGGFGKLLMRVIFAGVIITVLLLLSLA